MKRHHHVLTLWALLVIGLLVRTFADALVGATALAPLVMTPVQVDVNRATVAELRVLPGIGPARAAAMVLDRIRRGSFQRLEDLARIDGFGPTVLDDLRPYVVFGGVLSPSPAR